MTATYAEKTKKGAVEFYNDKGVLVETHSGGSLSWKDNNPGNIVYAHQHSAIGSYHASTGYTFAIFPTYEAGVAAAVHNLKSGIYAGAGLSIDQGLQKWTNLPSGSTQLKNYQHIVDTALDLPGTTHLKDLTDTQLHTVIVLGIQKAEGWSIGTDTTYC